MKKLAYILTLLIALSLPGLSQAYGSINLSQTNLSIAAGQNTTVTVTSTQAVYVSAVTNTYVAYANATGNIITVYGLSAGSSQITVCTYDNSCSSIFVTVGGNSSNSGSNGQVSLGQTNLNLNTNQTTSVTAYNSNGGSIYISNNSNPNVVSATLSGNTINVTGLNSGNSTVTICGNNASQCSFLSITVTGSTNPVTLSQTNLTLNTNQTASVTATSNSGSIYVSNNSNSNVASLYISGNTLNITGLNSGFTTITICGNNTSSCASLGVTVNNNSNSAISFSQNFITLNQYQNRIVTVFASGTPYVSSNSNPNAVSTALSGNSLNLYAQNPGTALVTICTQNSQCGTVNVTVSTTTGGSVLGASIYANGTLINDNGTIYITYKNTKSGFSSMDGFKGLGYKLSNLVYGSTSSLNFSGFVLNSANMAHPWGSWIKNGSTIYFVHETGLIPIASYPVFVNNGGRDNMLVDANYYDLLKPVQYLMDNNDSRLR
jgi:hypothetical protein